MQLKQAVSPTETCFSTHTIASISVAYTIKKSITWCELCETQLSTHQHSCDHDWPLQHNCPNMGNTFNLVHMQCFHAQILPGISSWQMALDLVLLAVILWASMWIAESLVEMVHMMSLCVARQVSLCLLPRWCIWCPCVWLVRFPSICCHDLQQHSHAQLTNHSLQTH